MDLRKCEASIRSGYQFVLDDLKIPDVRLIEALTSLAFEKDFEIMEDIDYCECIVDVIRRQVFMVRIFVYFLKIIVQN